MTEIKILPRQLQRFIHFGYAFRESETKAAASVTGDFFT